MCKLASIQFCFYQKFFLFLSRNIISVICVYIVGPSLAGKTALTAKVYRHQQALFTTAEDATILNGRFIVPVFCGSSATTANWQVLISLCRLISQALGLSMEGCADILRMDYKRFHQLVL